MVEVELKVWIRTCQECGHKQLAKPPHDYKDESWREIKCKRCKSIALDYGSALNVNPNDWIN